MVQLLHLQTVIVSAVSAALAACSTSVLFVLNLKDSNGHNLFKSDHHTTKSFNLPIEDNADQTHHLIPKQRPLRLTSSQDEDAEGVVWLMSFPNSGTTYTIKAVRELTRTTTATNYGLEGGVKEKESTPAFPDMKDAKNGPFLHVIPGREINIPKLLLTKTHCGGYCSSCMSFIQTPRSFFKACLQGQRGFIEDSKVTSEVVSYSSNLVKKAIHIFKNPFDNVVKRFHVYRKTQAQRHTDLLDTYPNNKEGFHKWCKQLNDRAATVLSSIHSEEKSLVDAMKDVPCMSEFYRYIHWHNLAFTVTSDLQIPSMLLHYEDYSTRFENVTRELTDFLGLEQVGKAPEFIVKKQYLDYYTEKDKRNIARFIRKFATKPTWQNVHHYLSDFVSVPVPMEA